MFAGSNRINSALTALFVMAIGGCGGMSSCAGHPLPEGGLPGYQTIEGGAQLRVTPAGFAKLASLLPGLINSALTGGFCVGPRDVANVNFCSRIPGGACGNQPGCSIGVGLVPGSVQLSPKDPGTLHIQASVKVDARAYVKIKLGFTKLECDAMRVHSDGIAVGADIETKISEADGSLSVRIARVTNFDAGAIQLSECSIISDIAGAFVSVFAGQISDAAIRTMTPLLQTAFQKFVPDPLGLQNAADISRLLGTNAAGPAVLETRLVAGGYANFSGNGLSMGVITGINSDADPTTREPQQTGTVRRASEPHRCSPALPVVDLGAPPLSLSAVNRSAIGNGPVFALRPAAEFTGAADAGSDLTVGVSQSALRLLGHHVVTSGALCLTIGTGPDFPTLNLSAFTVILPSVASLQTKDGNDPILLVGRPQRAIGIKVGDNTMASPALTAQISHLEIDLYGFLFERYVRLLTLDLSADVGINLEFEPSADGGASIKPMLVGLSGESIKVEVINSDFIKEKPEQLKTVLPTLFEVALQKIGNFQPIQIPAFAGFALADLSLRRVVTAEDSFLAVNATLRPGAAARELAARDPFAAHAVSVLDAELRPPQPASRGKARLIEVTNPAAEQIRNALTRTTGGTLPSVAFDVDRFDAPASANSRELEWSWNINGGMWRPFQSGSPLVISDPVFALQGKYTIGLQSRIKGDYRTVSSAIETQVVIDSVGPSVFISEVAWKDDFLVVPVRDGVSGKDVEVGFGPPGAALPTTPWLRQADATIPRAEFERLEKGGAVAVFARDPLGNKTVELVAPLDNSPSANRSGCQSSGASGVGGFVLILILGTFMRRRRQSEP